MGLTQVNLIKMIQHMTERCEMCSFQRADIISLSHKIERKLITVVCHAEDGNFELENASSMNSVFQDLSRLTAKFDEVMEKHKQGGTPASYYYYGLVEYINAIVLCNVEEHEINVLKEVQTYLSLEIG